MWLFIFCKLGSHQFDNLVRYQTVFLIDAIGRVLGKPREFEQGNFIQVNFSGVLDKEVGKKERQSFLLSDS